MKKVGLICLALVVTLGGLGIGYAAWTDEVTIDGTVNTGSLDIEVVNQSNTWVWKDTATDAMIRMHQYEYDPMNSYPPNADCILIAYADADCPAGTPPTLDDIVEVRFDNLFPDVDFVADFLLHYSGSVPAKVMVANITGTDTDGDAFDIGAEVEVYYYEATWDPATPEVDPVKGNRIVDILGYQMHYCDYILVEILIRLDQIPDNMNQTGTISGEIKVIQWNEY
jgi:predicted ribosomally synthesized peptide with SipW-like signal peptide